MSSSNGSAGINFNSQFIEKPGHKRPTNSDLIRNIKQESGKKQKKNQTVVHCNEGEGEEDSLALQLSPLSQPQPTFQAVKSPSLSNLSQKTCFSSQSQVRSPSSLTPSEKRSSKKVLNDYYSSPNNNCSVSTIKSWEYL